VEARNYQVAHVKQQGQDMILVLMDDLYWKRADADQQAQMNRLQDAAHQAGLAGHVVCVSQKGSKTMFRGPAPWAPFLQTLDWSTVTKNVNARLRCE
jgi:hypothetical protein